MKKLLALVIVAGLFLPLAVGCGDDTSKPKDKAGTGTKGGTTPPVTAPAKDKAGAPATPPADKKEK